MGTICFVILHYKNFAETDKCIRSILKMENSEKMQILTVNNSLQDESGAQLAQKYEAYPNVQVIASEEGAGFSRANNIGYRYAKEYFDPDFIAVLNNDIEFCQTDFEQRLRSIYEREGFGVLGPDVIHAGTGKHQNPIALRLRTAEEAERTIRKNELALRCFGIAYPALYVLEKLCGRTVPSLELGYEKQMEQVVLFGACLIFSKDFIRTQDDAFTPETPFFYEEYILACRCKREGIRMLYTPEIRIIHESGAETRHSFKSSRERMRFVLKNTAAGCRVYREYYCREEK